MTFHLRIAMVVVLSLMAGCSSSQVKVLRSSSRQSMAHQATLSLAGPWWWDDTLNRSVIYRHHLERLANREPETALSVLNALVARDGQPDELAALTDLSLRYGRRVEHSAPETSLGLYLAAAWLSYRHLTNSAAPVRDAEWNRRIEHSFNQATANTVELLQTLPGGLRTNHLASAWNKTYRIGAVSGDTADTLAYDQWLPADGLLPIGFRNHYTTEGLGAPLVAMRTNQLQTPLDQHRPDEGIIDPATAVLRFDSPDATSLTTQAVSLVFYNPVLTREILINGNATPLAADYTMPLATLLTRVKPLFKTRWSALFRPTETPRPHRLYLMEPYAKDRIPIIMVHGLRSTPLAWEQLTNELLGDPEVRRHYQVWHYLYPTGLPFLTSAAIFRDDIEEVRQLVDPDDDDYATHNMIVIGHSMGGLLARTLVTDTSEAVWDSTFARSIATLDPDMKEVTQLRRMFYFQPKPYVKRAIFLAVPHRGSKKVNTFWARYAAGRVHLSDDLHGFIASLKKTYPDLLKPEAAPLFARGYPNSIQALSPRVGGLMALAKLPVAPSIPFHSIIGDRGAGGGKHSSDGAVPYWSSHLDGAASELVVPSGHRVYENPQAMAEVKRILKLHLAQPQPGDQLAKRPVL